MDPRRQRKRLLHVALFWFDVQLVRDVSATCLESNSGPVFGCLVRVAGTSRQATDRHHTHRHTSHTLFFYFFHFFFLFLLFGCDTCSISTMTVPSSDTLSPTVIPTQTQSTTSVAPGQAIPTSEKDEIWSGILKGVASSKMVPTKNVLVLGKTLKAQHCNHNTHCVLATHTQQVIRAVASPRLSIT